MEKDVLHRWPDRVGSGASIRPGRRRRPGAVAGRPAGTSHVVAASHDSPIILPAQISLDEEEILPGRPVVFAMNKSDLPAGHEGTEEEVLIETYGGELVHTSALTGHAVRPLFRALGRRILEIGA